MTDTIRTELDLDAIEACANAATDGPWEEGGCVKPPATGPLLIAYGADFDQQIRDRNFIAAARTDVPALVAEVRRLRGEREHMELNPTGTVDWLKNRVNELNTQVADLTNRLHHAEQDNASLTRAGTAWANEVDALKREVERWKGKADRYRDRHDAAAKELSAERAKNMRIAMVKCWTNEDGKRFVFVTDLQKAMGVPTDVDAEVAR